MMSKRLRITLLLLAGTTLNLLLGLCLSLLFFIREYQGKALEVFWEYVSSGIFLSTLFFGNGSDPAVAIHTIYMNGTTQLLFWSLVALGCLKVLFWDEGGYKEAHEKGLHGTARFATAREIKKRFTKDVSGIVLGLYMGIRLIFPVVGGRNRHMVVFGGSRSGKTKAFIIPNVFHNSEQLHEHMVITSSKLDVYMATASTLRARGYEIHLVNMLDPLKSARYNPMDYVETSLDAQVLAKTIVTNTTDQNVKDKGDVWERAELALLKALILYVKNHRPKREHHLRNVLELGLSIGDDEDKATALFSKVPKDSPTRIAYRAFDQAKDRTRAGVLFGFAGRMSIFGEPEIAEFSATSDFNLNDLADPGKKVALFIVTPSEHDAVNVVPAMLIDQIYQVLFKKAREFPDEKLPREVSFLLDEIANIAPIANLTKKIATMGGHGMWTTLVFQSRHQFEERYGKAASAEIIDSCDTCLMMGTNDDGSKRSFSEKLGPTTVENPSLSESKNDRGESSSKSISHIRRDLKTAEEIGRLPEDELIIFQRAQYPVQAKKDFCTAWKEWDSIPKMMPEQIEKRAFEPPAVLDVDNILKDELTPDVVVREGINA